MWCLFYIIGLEILVSVFFVMFCNELIGCLKEFCGDVVVIVKKDMQLGEMFDGEGGYVVWVNVILVICSFDFKVLFIGFVYNVKLKCVIKKDQIVFFDDVEIVNDFDVVKLCQEMEQSFCLFKIVVE